MAVNKEISLALTCECSYCKNDAEFTEVARFFGDTIEDCYKVAVKEGWIFLRGKDGLHCYSKRCLLEEELWR